MEKGSDLRYALLCVIRRGRLIENCVYYFRQALIVLDLRDDGAAAKIRDPDCGCPSRSTTYDSAKLEK